MMKKFNKESLFSVEYLQTQSEIRIWKYNQLEKEHDNITIIWNSSLSVKRESKWDVIRKV